MQFLASAQAEAQGCDNNDDLACATYLYESDGLPISVSGSNVGATVESGEQAPPGTCTATSGQSAWWVWFSGDVGAPLAVDTEGSDFDTVLSVWKFGGEGTLEDMELVVCNDDINGGANRQSSVEFDPEENENYLISFRGYATNTGNISLNFGPSCGFSAINDYVECAATLNASPPQSAAYTNAVATVESNEPSSPCSQGDPTLWWQWTPTESGPVRFSSEGTQSNTTLSVYAGEDPVTGSYLACNSQYVDDFDVHSEVVIESIANTKYWIQLEARDGSFGVNVELKLEKLCSTTPANNYFQCASNLVAGQTATGSHEFTSLEPGEPTSCGFNERTTWWAYTPSEAGPLKVAASTQSFDSFSLAAFTGSTIDALTPIGCDEGGHGGGGPSDPELIFDGVAGTTYWFQLRSEYDDDVSITVDKLCEFAPTNNYFECATAALGALPIALSGTFQNADTEASEPLNCGFGDEASVWWSWKPTEEQPVLVDLEQEASPRTVAFYTGESLDALTEVGCANAGDFEPLVFLGSSNTTYWMQAIGFSGDTTFDVTMADPCQLDPTNDFVFCAKDLGSAAPVSSTLPSSGAVWDDDDDPDPSCSSTAYSLWWQWTSPQDAPVTLATPNAQNLSVWERNDQGELVEVGCATNSSGSASLTIQDPGTATYLIRLDTFSGDELTLDITDPCAGAAPPNDDFLCAERVSNDPFPLVLTGSNIDATVEAGEPAPPCQFSVGESVWWQWTPSEYDSVQIDTATAGFDTVLSVWTGTSVDALVPVVCDDDDGPGRTSVVQFEADRNETYWINVSGFNGFGVSETGDFELVIGRAVDGGFVALNPQRILDTRNATEGPFSTAWGPNETRTMQVTDVGGVPFDGVEAVVMHVTTVSPTAPFSWLTVVPTGDETPAEVSETAAHNFGTAGFTTELSNDVIIAKVGVEGAIDIFNKHGSVDLVIDVVGYHATDGGAGYEPLSPERILDSRNSTQGAYSTPWEQNVPRVVQVTGVGGVPDSQRVEAVALYVTPVSPSAASSWLTISPTGEGGSNTAAANFGTSAGVTALATDLVIVKVGDGGMVDVVNAIGTTDVVIDVAGYYIRGGGWGYVPQSPERVLDTREDVTPWSAGETRSVSAGGCGAAAAVVNITTVGPDGDISWLTVPETGDPSPSETAAMLFGTNAAVSQIVNDLTIASMGDSTEITVYNQYGNVDLVIDVVGLYGISAC